MISGKTLDEIIETDDEGMYDSRVSDIFDLSVRIKARSRIVNDDFRVTSYYIAFTDREMLEEIKSLGAEDRNVLYAALKQPLLLIYGNGESAVFRQGFDGMNAAVYNIKESKLSAEETEKLRELYKTGRKPGTEHDKKYSTMYKVSSKIKKEGFKIIMDKEGASFYLTELGALGKDGKNTLRYLSDMNTKEAMRFVYIMNYFSIIDTAKHNVYSMASTKGKNNRDIIKLTESNKAENDWLYDILEEVKKSGAKSLLVDTSDDEEYRPQGNAPSDMYR